jgi:hypothetical protein
MTLNRRKQRRQDLCRRSSKEACSVTPTFPCPIGVELQAPALHNDSCGSMHGVAHRDSFRWGLRRQNRSIDSIAGGEKRGRSPFFAA